MAALTWPNKDPEEVLDYELDWEARLTDAAQETTDTISSSSWVVPSGITKNSDSNTDTTTTIWLSGGTLGETYEFLNRIVTAGGRTMDQTVKIKIRAR